MYVSDTAYSQKSLLVFSLWGCVCVCVYMLYFEIFMQSNLSVFSLLTFEFLSFRKGNHIPNFKIYPIFF